jgi:putative membrane-bound dehydrogenase-like protein
MFEFMLLRRQFLRLLMIVTLLANSRSQSQADDQPLQFPRIPATEARGAAKTFEVQDGFRMTLLASEPLVTSPVALEYDEHGQGWVLEMRDYPFTDKTTDRPFADKSTDLPLGRIRVLRDSDGDGVFDKSTIFADEISWPTGIAFWKGGVFVAATPDIWYMKDSDGDGRADIRRKLFTGFRKFNIQAVINNLKWGLDHQIYGAGGTNGGKILSLENPDALPLTFGANDFRIDPVTGSFAALSGGARFGMSFDDWGNRFLCNIRNPVIHVVLPAHYLARNPAVPVQKAMFDAAPAGDTLPVFRSSPSEAWRTLRAQRWSGDAEGLLYPRSELVPDGYFTSACGITIYRGSAYPAAYRGQAFLADVASNLVHREALAPQGVTFQARRIDERTEFVRSTDVWFRPVNFVNAPDGTLHVVDMYRETIEHPWSIPDDIKAALDLESGRDSGRLWRLEPPDFRCSQFTNLAGAATIELVAFLEHPNAWHRDTAHRLIFERQDPAAIAGLRQLLETSGEPQARLHALWSLAGMNALTEADLLVALRDSVAGLREHAVRLAESRFEAHSALLARVVELAGDPNARVRFQVAFSLGAVDNPDVRIALARIGRHDAADEHIRAAVLSSAAHRGADLMGLLFHDPEFTTTESARLLFRQLALSVGGESDPGELKSVARALLSSPAGANARMWQTEIVCGLGEGLRRKGKSLDAVFQDIEPAVNTLAAALLQDAGRIVSDGNAELASRIQAVQLLGYAPFSVARNPLLSCLESRQPSELQLVSIRTLSDFANGEVGPLLLAGWTQSSPAARMEIVEALLARPERIGSLLDEIEQGRIGIGQVSPVRRGRLMRHADPLIQRRAQALFAIDAPGARDAVILEYEQKLGKLQASRDRGSVVFQRECAGCHRFGIVGYEVGPNLETIRHHAPKQVLANLLDPNRDVSPAYVEYAVILRDGRTATGIISSETATSITLRRTNGVQETLLRETIEEFAGSGKSLMPEGLEKKLTPQDIADLFAFLLNKPPTAVPVNTRSEK